MIRTALIRCAQLMALIVLVFTAQLALAGGPRAVAGSTWFNPAAMGTPVHWQQGKVNYYVDKGALSATVSNAQATAMVDAAAALWSNVETAAVKLTNKGQLNEDVSAANITVSSGFLTAPSDVSASATSYPLAVIFDNDGAVIDALYGSYSSEPDNCSKNGVYVWLDNINPDATVAHAVILLNGRCTATPDLVQMMNFNVERAFGQVLGLGFAQINPDALTNVVVGGTQAWPIMQPLDGVCGASGGVCIPLDTELHADDVAELSRLYPVTSANLSSFSGKKLTADNTVSITGTINFRSGYGMQGVNVVVRALDASGNPMYQYTVSAVSGALFRGTHGNPMTGANDAKGVPLSWWGSTESALQGSFDLSALPLPPGMTSAAFQVSFEKVDANYIREAAVGSYTLGQVAASGTLASFTTPVLSAGQSKSYTILAEDSAQADANDAIGTEAQPRMLAASGFWVGRLSQIGQADWFLFAARAGRTFTVVTEALDEASQPTSQKAMPMLGVWSAQDAVGSTPVTYTGALNALTSGATALQASTGADALVRVGVADERGDGRPDYHYSGWVLYADTVEPARLPASGGVIVIHGMGFRSNDTVLVGGQAALVTSITPNEITAIAPASVGGATGSVNVEVDDDPGLNAATVISGGLSYDAGTGDALTLLTAPMNTVPKATPMPFTVIALAADMTPASGVQVTYAVTTGTATLGCGQATCTVTATGDGHATMAVTAVDSTPSVVVASLANGSSLQAHFTGGTPATVTALTTRLSIASGATVTWPVQALVLASGSPVANQAVAWQTSVSGIAPQGTAAALTSTTGIASKSLTVGPLLEGQVVTIQACVNGTSNCASFSAIGARPQYALLQAVTGTAQSLATGTTPTNMVFRLLDMDGNPMAGGTVALYQSLYAWTQPCSAHTVCTSGALLATQSSVAISALDGTVSFAPASLSGVATELHALAASGFTATVMATVERHP